MKTVINIKGLMFFFGIFCSFKCTSQEKFSAFFQTNKIKILKDTTQLFNYYQSRAYILKNKTRNLESWRGYKSGNVLFNNKPLFYNTGARGYFDTIMRLNNEGIVWTLQNSDSLPNFNYTSLNSYPTFSNTQTIPNLMRKSQNYSIDLSNAANFDEIEFIIEDTQMHLVTPWYRIVTARNELVIPSVNLSTLVGPVIRVWVILIKNESHCVNGICFKFQNRFSVVKYVNLNN